jgi:hypothetical protein
LQIGFNLSRKSEKKINQTSINGGIDAGIFLGGRFAARAVGQSRPIQGRLAAVADRDRIGSRQRSGTFLPVNWRVYLPMFTPDSAPFRRLHAC